MTPLLILLLILVILAGLVFIVHSKIREYTRMLFGTEDISKAARQMQEEYSATPKSVCAMTSLMLPKITADFPDFDYDEMKSRAGNVLLSYLRAVTENNPGLLQDGNTELKQQLEHQIQQLSVQDQKEHFDHIRVHRMEISQYRKAAGRCIITFQCALECYHYITDTGQRIIEGTKDYLYQTRFNVDMIYIQNRDLVENQLDNALGVNCPNCGAPLTSLGAAHCEYCGSPVVPINIHAWSFSHIEEIK